MPRNVKWIDEQTRSKDLSGKVYIVTGANSGVGLETTRQLIKQGGHVVMGCRRVDAAEEVARDFAGLPGSYEIIRIDLADLDSVRAFVGAFLAKHDSLDGLAGNAGMVNIKGHLVRTKDGFEQTIGISYFGHFLLTELLLDTLKATPGSRVVLVSSVVHAGSRRNRPRVHLDDLNYETREFGNFAAYAEAKVANILFMAALARRLDGTGVSTASVHPGWARSNFGSGGGLACGSPWPSCGRSHASSPTATRSPPRPACTACSPTTPPSTPVPTSASRACSTATANAARAAGPWNRPTRTPATSTLPRSSSTSATTSSDSTSPE